MYNSRIQNIPVVAFGLTLSTLALALTTILTGITGSHPKSAAIATFNISSLGLSAFHDQTSPLHGNISSLVPQDLTDPPSITKYLGTHDWYRIHYFANCSGFYAPSTTNLSLLTSTEINITCTHRGSGYRFPLHDVIQYELLPEFRGLAEDVSTNVWDTSSWSALWFTGLSNCFVTILQLPWTFSGRRNWLYFWNAWNTFVSAVLFLAESALITDRVLNLHHANGLPSPNPWSWRWMGLTWSTTVLMWVVFAMMTVQWRRERGNECGDCGREEGSRMATSSGVPNEEWKSEKTFVNTEKA